MSQVNIGKTVDYKTLGTALIKAAEEVGWKINIKDKFEKSYKLGSVKEFNDYFYTMANLKGRFFSAAGITIYSKESVGTFYINRWNASEKKVKKYLDAVSRNL